MIAGQSQRLADLVEEILITSQLDSGSLRVSSEPFDAEDVVRSSLMTPACAWARSERSRSISRRTSAGLRRRRPYAQVLLNLVDNAAKYSPDGSRILVIVDVDDEHVRFAVSDEGLGIRSTSRNRSSKSSTGSIRTIGAA